MAEDRAFDKADEVPKLLYNFAAEVDEDELLEGTVEVELLFPPLDELNIDESMSELCRRSDHKRLFTWT